MINNLPLCHWWQQLILPIRAWSHLNLSPFGINGKGWPQLHLIMTSLQATPPINMHHWSSDLVDLYKLSHLLSLTFGFIYRPKVPMVWEDLKAGCPHDKHHLYIYQSLPNVIALSSSSKPVPFLFLQHLPSDHYLFNCLVLSSMVHMFFGLTHSSWVVFWSTINLGLYAQNHHNCRTSWCNK